MSKDRVSRKDFVVSIGAAGAVVSSISQTPTAAEAATTPAHESKTTKAPAKRPNAKPLGLRPEAYVYLTAPEVAFVEAAVERLVPSDSLSPGGKELGIAYYIDALLTGQYGYAAKMYRQGPWSVALPTQGYQLALTPRDVYRLGIAATNDHCKKTYDKTFDALDAQHQDAVLSNLEGAKLSFDQVPAKTFFEMLYANTVEGFFSDPIYGGNREKAGWKTIGFPGAAAAYIGFIEDHNKPYNVAPIGIADVEQQTGMIDPDAHEAHVTVHQLAMKGRVK